MALDRLANNYFNLDEYIISVLDEAANKTKNIGVIKNEKLVSHRIKKVIKNPPATIILWEDGTKTIVKCMDGDVYDPEKGFLYCVAKRFFENTGCNYKKIMDEIGCYDKEPKKTSYIDDEYSIFNDEDIVEELKDSMRCFSEKEWKETIRMMEVQLLIPDEFKSILRMPEYIKLHFDMLPESVRYEKTIKPLLKIMREVRRENKNLGR